MAGAAKAQGAPVSAPAAHLCQEAAAPLDVRPWHLEGVGLRAPFALPGGPLQPLCYEDKLKELGVLWAFTPGCSRTRSCGIERREAVVSISNLSCSFYPAERIAQSVHFSPTSTITFCLESPSSESCRLTPSAPNTLPYTPTHQPHGPQQSLSVLSVAWTVASPFVKPSLLL